MIRMEDEWGDRVHEVMMSTIDLIQRGETEQAFVELDRALADALRDKQEAWVQTLCKHAAVMALAAGDRSREIHYTKQALPFARDRQFALYNLAKVLRLDGQIDLAETYATEAYQLSIGEENQDNRDLAAVILKVWPHIAKS